MGEVHIPTFRGCAFSDAPVSMLAGLQPFSVGSDAVVVAAWDLSGCRGSFLLPLAVVQSSR